MKLPAESTISSAARRAIWRSYSRKCTTQRRPRRSRRTPREITAVRDNHAELPAGPQSAPRQSGGVLHANARSRAGLRRSRRTPRAITAVRDNHAELPAGPQSAPRQSGGVLHANARSRAGLGDRAKRRSRLLVPAIVTLLARWSTIGSAAIWRSTARKCAIPRRPPRSRRMSRAITGARDSHADCPLVHNRLRGNLAEYCTQMRDPAPASAIAQNAARNYGCPR